MFMPYDFPERFGPRKGKRGIEAPLTALIIEEAANMALESEVKDFRRERNRRQGTGSWGFQRPCQMMIGFRHRWKAAISAVHEVVSRVKFLKSLVFKGSRLQP
jgi:hypothetical protein